MLIVFGRKGCPYCEAAKQLLLFKNKTHKYFDITTPKGLKEKSKYKVIPKTFNTVPAVIQITNDKKKKSRKKKLSNKKKKKIKFIGGFEELKKLLILS